jgi:hypothetical protein
MDLTNEKKNTEWRKMKKAFKKKDDDEKCRLIRGVFGQHVQFRIYSFFLLSIDSVPSPVAIKPKKNKNKT